MSFPVISYAAARKWEPMAARKGVSKVARSSRGFMRAYQRAGSWAKLPESWKRKRNAFVARHMAQVRQNRERLWQGGQPSRRALALIMWAYMPPRSNPARRIIVDDDWARDKVHTMSLEVLEYDEEDIVAEFQHKEFTVHFVGGDNYLQWVAFDNKGQAVGAGNFDFIGSDAWTARSQAVLPRAQRKGLYKAVLQWVLSYIYPARLESDAEQTRGSEAVWRSMGAVDEGEYWVLNNPMDASTGLQINADGTVTLYHHTDAASARRIVASGVLKAKAEPDVYLTTESRPITGYGPAVVAVSVKPSQVILDDEFPDGRLDFRLPVGKPGGSIRIEAHKGGAMQRKKNPRHRWTGSALGSISGRKARSLGLSSGLSAWELQQEAKKESEAVVRARLEKSPKFQNEDGTPDRRKIDWFINKLYEEGKIMKRKKNPSSNEKVQTKTSTYKPDKEDLDPRFVGVFADPRFVPPKANDSDTVVVWRGEYGRWELWAYADMGRAGGEWGWMRDGTKEAMIKRAKEIVA